jgi:hypothetical protein
MGKGYAVSRAGNSRGTTRMVRASRSILGGRIGATYGAERKATGSV